MAVNKDAKISTADKNFFRSRYGNRVQLNFSQESDTEGNVYKRSLLLNIRSDDVQEAVELYTDLKNRLEQLDNGATEAMGKDKNTINGKAPKCDCGRTMIKRVGRFGPFWSCAYPICKNTKSVEETQESQVLPEIVFT